MKYKKIVDLTTGVQTRISDKLEGTIEVIYTIKDVFNEKIK